jgi:hypothetical protein
MTGGSFETSTSPNKINRKKWQARRDSNPQQADLESAALPLELLTYVFILVAPTCSVGQEQRYLFRVF